LDHAQVDADLTKEGIDHTTFWNIWRLTPQVYRHKENQPWLTKHEPHKLEPDGIKDRAAYALDAMVEVLLARQANKRMTKWISERARYVAWLRTEGVTVYSKADKSSTEVGKTPVGLKEIAVLYATPALDGDGQFWNVMHFEKGGPYLIGFIAEEDLKFD